MYFIKNMKKRVASCQQTFIFVSSALSEDGDNSDQVLHLRKLHICVFDKLFLVYDSPLSLLVFERNVILINNSSDTTLYATKIDQIFFSVFKIIDIFFLFFVIG